MHILIVDGPVPPTWALDDDPFLQRLQSSFEAVSLGGLPGGSSLEILDGQEEFRAMYTVGISQDLELEALDRARAHVADQLQDIGVDHLMCQWRLHPLPATE
jgi:hypothetical protein